MSSFTWKHEDKISEKKKFKKKKGVLFHQELTLSQTAECTYVAEIPSDPSTHFHGADPVFSHFKKKQTSIYKLTKGHLHFYGTCVLTLFTGTASESRRTLALTVDMVTRVSQSTVAFLLALVAIPTKLAC